MQKEANKLKQQKLHQLQQDELDKYKQRKALEDQQHEKEDQMILAKQKQNDDKLYDDINKYKNKINNANRQIYSTLSKLDPNLQNATNDFEVNRILAEQKAKERENNRLKENKLGNDDYLKTLMDLDEKNRLEKENKLKNQKLYKEYLDNQNQMDHLNKLKQNDEDTRPSVIMPSYYYPNIDIATKRKAKDSLLFSKNQEKYFEKDMNRFFRWDSQYNTLMDYEHKNSYLGDSSLAHNPITCPVDDYGYNKYINKLKKDSEIIPNDYDHNEFYNNNRTNYNQIYNNRNIQPNLYTRPQQQNINNNNYNNQNNYNQNNYNQNRNYNQVPQQRQQINNNNNGNYNQPPQQNFNNNNSRNYNNDNNNQFRNQNMQSQRLAVNGQNVIN
jgi:hypothetical protein